CVERGSDRQEDEAEYVQPGYTKQDQSDTIEQEAGSHGYCAQCTTGQHAADLLSWRQTLTSQTRDPGGASDEVDQHQPKRSAERDDVEPGRANSRHDDSCESQKQTEDNRCKGDSRQIGGSSTRRRADLRRIGIDSKGEHGVAPDRGQGYADRDDSE